MTSEPLSGPSEADPAAVFAAALSLWKAVHEHRSHNPDFNLSEAYNGGDEFMRVVMRIGRQFEEWACVHVVFEELVEVWPYHLEDRFGAACISAIEAGALASFDDADCLRVALRLQLPIRLDTTLRLPIDVRAPNPITKSGFREFRIQTVRDAINEAAVIPFTTDDDPFDEDFGQPYFALYGVGGDGLLEHVADRTTYDAALSLAQKLAPGVTLPQEPVCRGPERKDAGVDGAPMTRRGYCIFIHTLCQGPVPSVRESKADDPPDAQQRVCIFDTEREAQREIADFMMTRLQEFMDGEREFEDATTTEEFVVAVTVQPDGTIIDEDGRRIDSRAQL